MEFSFLLFCKVGFRGGIGAEVKEMCVRKVSSVVLLDSQQTYHFSTSSRSPMLELDYYFCLVVITVID